MFSRSLFILLLTGVFLPGVVLSQSHATRNYVDLSAVVGNASSSNYHVFMAGGLPLMGESFAPGGVELETGSLLFYGGGLDDDISGPLLSLANLPTQGDAGNELSFILEANDLSGISAVTLNYRKGGDPAFTTLPANDEGGNVYLAQLPESEATSRGLEYHIVAEDGAGNLSRFPTVGSQSVLISVPEPGIESALPASDRQYRLISSPFDLDVKSIEKVLNSLGPYDDTKWRLFELKSNYFEFEGDAIYNEFPSTSSFTPGKAFWLISRFGGRLESGAGFTLDISEPFRLSLNRGWNLISNPFNFAIPVTNVALVSGVAPDVHEYDHTTGWRRPANLIPLQGYAVFTDRADDTLILNPDLSSSFVNNKHVPADAKPLWSIDVIAKTSNTLDTYTTLSINELAAEGEDRFDRPEPLVIGDYITAYFPHEDRQAVSRKLGVDARPASDGQSWDLEIITANREHVQLEFEGMMNVQPASQIVLIDVNNSSKINLRENDRYDYYSSVPELPRPFKIIVGRDEYVEGEIEHLNLLPENTALKQNYPNPFTKVTTIRYDLDEKSRVTLTVHNILGQKITTLVDGILKEGGSHIVTWDPSSFDAGKLASGLYVCTLMVEPDGVHDDSVQYERITMKMLYVK